MSTLALLVILLLVLVVVLVFGGIGYLAYRHPATREPLLVAFSGVAMLAAIIGPILTR
ncbi:hypothetical protein ACFV29_39950 [Streptomyces sp. NPDC059690]|uniref:hypothetical protein n=1 Tax=Streptomyces sp. NPDC059690 TaxID=3346907 RepID=UPI0036765C4A